MSVDNLDEFEDDYEEQDFGGVGSYCVDLVIGIETPEGAPAQGITFDIEIRSDEPLSRDEIAAQVFDQTQFRMAFYLSSTGFTKRFGDAPTLTIIGETIYRC